MYTILLIVLGYVISVLVTWCFIRYCYTHQWKGSVISNATVVMTVLPVVNIAASITMGAILVLEDTKLDLSDGRWFFLIHEDKKDYEKAEGQEGAKEK